MQLLSLSLILAAFLAVSTAFGNEDDPGSASNQDSVVELVDQNLFKQLCTQEYFLKKDLDTTESHEVKSMLEQEYNEAMQKRIQLGHKLKIFFCPPELWESIELDESNRRSSRLAKELAASGENPLKDGEEQQQDELDDQSAPELVKAGAAVVEPTEERLDYFKQLCELEYASKKRADVSKGSEFNFYWKLYTRATNIRISLGHSLNIFQCPPSVWKRAPKQTAKDPTGDCSQICRAITLCKRFNKAVREEGYDHYVEAAHLLKEWCELEKFLLVKKDQFMRPIVCSRPSKSMEDEALSNAEDWLFLVRAEDVAIKAEQEKGTYAGQPLVMINRIEVEEPKPSKKSKKFFSLAWFSTKNKKCNKD